MVILVILVRRLLRSVTKTNFKRSIKPGSNQYGAEEKIRIVLDGLRGEDPQTSQRV